MLRGLFVTGTDTGVGKTVVSAALLEQLRPTVRVRYWKPIQTGIEADDDTATVRSLGAGAGEVLDEGIRLRLPLSPHLSARLSGVSIALDELISIAARQPDSDRWIVEGAGGVLVPVNDSELMIHLILRLAMPVLVVARTSLGTINHTLLTLEVLRLHQAQTIGVMLVGDRNEENRRAIERYGSTPVLGLLSRVAPLTCETLRKAVSDLDLQEITRWMNRPSHRA
jgi:dethiobiotin synthetase